MPRATIEVWDPDQILMPFERPGDARQDAVVWGANLTVTFGDVVGRKTADNLFYTVTAATLGNFKGATCLAMYSFKTDADGKVIYDAVATPSVRAGGRFHTSPIWMTGVFKQTDIKINGVAQVAGFDFATVGLKFTIRPHDAIELTS